MRNGRSQEKLARVTERSTFPNLDTNGLSPWRMEHGTASPGVKNKLDAQRKNDMQESRPRRLSINREAGDMEEARGRHLTE